MDDLKMIKGGTDAQRKIAQDRQKKREVKNKGFKPDVRKSQLGKWSEGIKKAPKKGNDPASSALVKQEPSSSSLKKTGQTAAEKEHPQRSASGSAGDPKTNKTYRSGPKETPKPEKPEKGPSANELRAREKHDAWKQDREERKAKEAEKAKSKKKKGPGLLGKAIDHVKGEFKKTGSTGVSTSGNLEGLPQNNY